MASRSASPSPTKHVTQTQQDDLELLAQGYQSEMTRRFSPWTLMAMSYALLSTWTCVGSAFGPGFADAGSAGTLWTLVIAAFMTGISSVGMAELASAYPVAGAQYYWSYVVSREDWAPFASYVSACVSTLGWWLGLASVCNFMSSMTLGIVVLNYPDYTIVSWHNWLLYVGYIWLACAINIFGTKILPQFNAFQGSFSVFMLFASMITILACAAPNFQSASYVFAKTTNNTGWSNDGLAFILCLLNSLYGYLGVDCPAHMCEEIPDPRKNVPKAIMWPIALGLLTAFPFAVSLLFVITDIDQIVDTPTGMPLIEVYYQATGSKAGTTLLMLGFAWCTFGGAITNITTSSRQIWAASRDDCFPGSKYWRYVHPKYELPIYAVCLSGALTSLYGLIFIASTTTFSSMVGALIVFMNTSYVIPQGILAWRGRDRILPARKMDLGRYGFAINVIACLWVLFVNVAYCIPTAYPVTTENMNWISVVTVGCMTFVVLAWVFFQRYVFKGPSISLGANVAALEVTEGRPVHVGKAAEEILKTDGK